MFPAVSPPRPSGGSSGQYVVFTARDLDAKGPASEEARLPVPGAEGSPVPGDGMGGAPAASLAGHTAPAGKHAGFQPCSQGRSGLILAASVPPNGPHICPP